MQEIVEKYWYVILIGVVVIALLLKRGQSSAPMLQQFGGVDSGTLALAQLNEQSAQQNADRQFGFATAFLNYDLANKQLGFTMPLAELNAKTQQAALDSQAQLAQLQFVLAQNQVNSQAQLQAQAINAQAAAQRRHDWLGLFSTGIDLAGGIFGL